MLLTRWYSKPYHISWMIWTYTHAHTHNPQRDIDQHSFWCCSVSLTIIISDVPFDFTVRPFIFFFYQFINGQINTDHFEMKRNALFCCGLLVVRKRVRVWYTFYPIPWTQNLMDEKKKTGWSIIILIHKHIINSNRI